MVPVDSSASAAQSSIAQTQTEVNTVVNTTEDQQALAEAEAQKIAALWNTLTPLEQKVLIGYVEYNMGWRTCVRNFGLDDKYHFLNILERATAKLGGGELRRFTGNQRERVNP